LRVTDETFEQLEMLVGLTFGNGNRTSVIVSLIDQAARPHEGRPSRQRELANKSSEALKRMKDVPKQATARRGRAPK
jgi:hypothetical protein